MTTIKEHWLMQCKIRTIGALTCPPECSTHSKRVYRSVQCFLTSFVLCSRLTGALPRAATTMAITALKFLSSKQSWNQGKQYTQNAIIFTLPSLKSYTSLFGGRRRLLLIRVKNILRLLCDHKSSSGDQEYQKEIQVQLISLAFHILFNFFSG